MYVSVAHAVKNVESIVEVKLLSKHDGQSFCFMSSIIVKVYTRTIVE